MTDEPTTSKPAIKPASNPDTVYKPLFEFEKRTMGSWAVSHQLLRWGDIRIRLLGKDQHGYRCIKITKGKSIPIYIRVGNHIEVWRNNRRMQ